MDSDHRVVMETVDGSMAYYGAADTDRCVVTDPNLGSMAYMGRMNADLRPLTDPVDGPMAFTGVGAGYIRPWPPCMPSDPNPVPSFRRDSYPPAPKYANRT
jgi:hypothetical protein